MRTEAIVILTYPNKGNSNWWDTSEKTLLKLEFNL